MLAVDERFPAVRRLNTGWRPRILLNSDDEIAYWLHELHVSEPELRLAIAAVGSEVQSVVEYLAQHER